MAGKVTEITGGDGKKWRIRFSLQALGWFEQQTGIHVMQLNDANIASMYLNDMAYLFASGLYHENPDVGLAEGYELMESLENEQAQKQIWAALRRDRGGDLPPDETAKKSGGGSKKKSSGTGTK